MQYNGIYATYATDATDATYVSHYKKIIHNKMLRDKIDINLYIYSRNGK